MSDVSEKIKVALLCTPLDNDMIMTNYISDTWLYFVAIPTYLEDSVNWHQIFGKLTGTL